MHVSPVPTRPPGRQRSAAWAAAQIVVPIAALFVTVTVALAGRALEPAAVPHPAGADAAPTASPSARPARATPTPRADEARRETPTTAFRLPVQSVPDALSDAVAAAPPDHLVAVAGSFTLDPRVTGCPRRQSLAEHLCERTGMLADSDRPLLAVDDDGVDPEAVRLTVAFPQFGVRVPVGVALPTMVIWASAVEGAIEPVPVVLVGRFDDALADCSADQPRCLPRFVLERVAWVAGEWSDAIVVRSASVPAGAVPAADRATRVIATREVDRDEPILSRALLTLDDLRLVDPAAAGAIAVEVDGPVWYVRSVGRPTDPDSPRAVAWAVLDQRTGLILASGTSGSR
jgi:hypothetical protein